MKKELIESEFENGIFLLQPSHPILCTTKNEDDTDHLAPFSWCTPCSMNPLLINLSLRCKPDKQQTLINIERTGEFVINLPDAKYAEDIVLASFWQRFNENKFDRSLFTKLPSLKVKPVGIVECATNLECKVVNYFSPGDHTIITAEVLAARYDDEIFSDHWLLNIDKFTPLFHLNHYLHEDWGQVHVFCEASKLKIAEVCFLNSEQTSQRCAIGKDKNKKG